MQLVLDTNIVVSALVYGGKPGEVLELARTSKIQAVCSESILAEILRVLEVKFQFGGPRLQIVKKLFGKRMILVKPEQRLHILADEPDNRILEAAVAGGCGYIITGDKLLLKLEIYQEIRILNADQSLKLFF